MCKFFLTCASVVLLSSTVGISQDCLNYFDYIHKSASSEMPSPVESAVVHSDFLYTAVPDSGLLVFDIFDIQEPTFVVCLEGVLEPRDIVIGGNYAYVMGSNFYCINISNPSAPVVVGQTGGSGSWSLEVSGNYAYMANGEAGASIVDVSDPESPFQVASIPSSSGIIRDVAVNGTNLFLVIQRNPIYYSVLQRFDVSDPSNPIEADNVPLNDVWSVDVNDYYAYVGRDNYISIVRVYSTHMDLISNYILNVPGEIYDILITDNLLFAAQAEHGLHFIDITDPYSPLSGGIIQSAGNPRRMKFNTEYGVVSGTSFDIDYGFIDLVDISNLELTPTLGNIDIVIRDLGASGNFIHAVSNAIGYNVIDISNPLSPHVISELNIPNYPQKICVSGDYAYIYVSNNPNFYTVDISFPWEPQIASSTFIDFDGECNDMSVYLDYIFLANRTNNSQIIDVSIPESPTIIGNIPEQTNAITCNDTIAYCALSTYHGAPSGLIIYRLSDMALPEYIGEVSSTTEILDLK